MGQHEMIWTKSHGHELGDSAIRKRQPPLLVLARLEEAENFGHASKCYAITSQDGRGALSFFTLHGTLLWEWRLGNC